MLGPELVENFEANDSEFLFRISIRTRKLTFSGNSEADASELLENCEQVFSLFYLHNEK